MTFADFLLSFLLSFELRLTAGLFLFATKMEKRDHFYVRTLVFLPLLSVPIFAGVFGFNSTFALMVGWFSFQFPIELLWGLGCVLFCFRVDWKRLLYIATGAYTWQNAVNAFAWSHIMRLRLFGSPWMYFAYLATFVVFWVVLYFAVLKRKWFITSARMDPLPLVFSIALSLGILLVYSSYLTFGVNAGAEVHLNQFIISVLILIMLLLIIRNNVRVTEKEILRRLLYEKEREYRVTQETINLINQKSHDLKKIIAFLESNTEGPLLEETKSIEESIRKYDSIVQTGNDTVDIVLSEKKLYCANHDINFSCVVDGKVFDIMSDVDVYTLLANALDNAIEATMQVDEETKRNIALRVTRNGAMAQLRLTNSYAIEPKFVSGMPITTKGDKQYHGFGLQSIKTTAKKYGGYFSCDASGGRFTLKVAFPLEPPTTR